MITPMANVPTADELRPLKEQAVNFIRFAREQNASSLVAEVELDGEPAVKYIVSRKVEMDPVTETYTKDNGETEEVIGSMSSKVTEHVTVKRGRSSGQVILFAGPAAWLED